MLIGRATLTQLLFEMRPAAYKRILAQREDNAKWLRCKVEPFILGAPKPAALAVSGMASIRAGSA